MESVSIPVTPRRTLSQKSSGKIMLLVAFLCFITLGMHDGLLGVAWPSMRETFGVTLDSLGIILMASTAGFFLSSFNNGWLASVFEIGALLLVANLFRVVGLLGYALFPHWLGIVFSALVVGLGAGTIDSGMNTYVAANYGSGRLNWLHACYALGATLTPLIVTGLLVAGQSWRWGYVVTATVQLGLVLYFALTMKQWKTRLNPERSWQGISTTCQKLRYTALGRRLVGNFCVSNFHRHRAGSRSMELHPIHRGSGCSGQYGWIVGEHLLGLLCSGAFPVRVFGRPRQSHLAFEGKSDRYGGGDRPHLVESQQLGWFRRVGYYGVLDGSPAACVGGRDAKTVWRPACHECHRIRGGSDQSGSCIGTCRHGRAGSQSGIGNNRALLVDCGGLDLCPTRDFG